MSAEDEQWLRGAVGALQTAVAIAFSEMASFQSRGDVDLAKSHLERMLHLLGGSVPETLALFEATSRPACAAGYEESVEAVTQIARAAINLADG